jgi:hypothetical protein
MSDAAVRDGLEPATSGVTGRAEGGDRRRRKTMHDGNYAG